MIIQRAVKGDLEEILRLQILAYQSEARLLNDPNIPPLRQTIEELESEFERGIFLKLLAEDGRLIASVRGMTKGETLHIGKLMVHPDWQGQGLGTRLLIEIEHWCPHRRYELFTSSKSFRNLEFYERHGYQAFFRQAVSEEWQIIFLEKMG